MKNWCPKCHKQNAQTANFCLFCGMKLSADADVEVGKIDFLLAELTDWQRRGLVWGAAFETLRAEYVSRRSELLGESQETEEPVKPQPVQQPLSIDMAQKLLKDGEYTEALKVCSELLDKYPRSAALFSLRANAHERSGNLEQAAEDAMRAWALDKNNQFYTGQARRLQRAAAGDSPDSETPPTPAPAKVEFTKPARAVSPPSPPTVEMESRASHATGAPLPSKPEIDWIGWLNAFLEERNIQRGWVIVGLLLVGGFIGLVKQTWGAVGEYVLYLGLVGATAGSYFGGRKLTRLGEGWKVSGFCLMTMGMLLLPLDVIALRQRLALSPAALGLLTSAVCLIAYTTATWRMRVEWFAYITGAACLSTLYYLLQILKVSPSCYGLFTMPLAFAALYLGWRCRESEHRLFSQPLVRMAHGVVALTYVIMMAHWRFFLTQGIFQSVGVVAMGTALYTASGYLFDEYASVYLSAGLAVAFSLLLTQGLAPDLAWQHARLIVLLVTFGLLVGGLVSEQSLKREKLSEGYRWSGVVLAGLLVATIAGEGFAVKLVPQPSPELISTIVVSLLSAALYAWMTYLFQRPAMTYVTGGLFAYTIFLVMVQARVACAWWSLGLAAVAWAYCGVAHWIEDVTSPVSGTPTTGAQIDPDRHAPRGALSRIAGCDSPLYDTAHIVAAVAALIALGLGFSHDERASVATGTTLTLVALTALYVYTAWRASNPSWLHAGILCFGLGVRFASLLVDWDLVLRLGLPHFFLEENFGWQVSGLAAALVLLGWRLQQQKMEGFAKPVLQWAIGLGGVGLLSLPFHYFGGEGLRSTAAALYVYAAIALGASVLFRHVEVQGTEVSLPSLLTYLGAALIPMGQFCVCDLLNLGYPLSALIAAILSLVYLLAADALFRFEDKGVWSQPLFALAHSLSFVAVVLGVGHYYAATGLDIKNQVAAGEALMTMSTSAVALLLAIGGVVLQRKPYFACLGSAYGLALYATLLHRLPSLVNAAERNYGLLFLPFVCLLLITAVLCRRNRENAIFPAAGAAAVAVASVTWQFWYGLSGLHASVLATLLSYAALTLAVALILRQPLALCGVTFLCAWATTHVGLWLRHAEPLLGLEQVVLAWVYLAVAVYLTK
ncbi:MAG: zinc ribbon domain-containing protein, partial [Armatimonadetes bacterium]|nr:zinc ribbon domain-containing protein [Armatimonadota bacterium]